jgi:PAS domain S-box-containing protein
LSPPISRDDRALEAAATRSGSPTRRPEVVLAAILVGCGLVALTVAYLSESVGVMGGALALAAGLLIFLQGRALARSNRALKKQVALLERDQDCERASQDELSRILASVGECLWSTSVRPDGTLERQYTSPEFEQLTGYPVEFFSVEGCSEEMGNEPWLQLILPEDLRRVLVPYDRMESGASDRAVCEYRITRSDGEVVWIRDNWVVTRYPTGVVRYDGIVTDISALKRAENSEHKAVHEISRILASVDECLWTLRIAPDGSVDHDYISPAIEGLCGYPPEQIKTPEQAFTPGSVMLEDDPWLRLVVPEDRHQVAEAFEELYEGKLDRKVSEYRLTRSDGEIVWIRDNCVATRHPSGAVQIDGVLTDVSAYKQAEERQRKLEERIQQKQKLEGIGVLAGGIAHDFNNLLLVILGRAGLAVSSGDCPNYIRENLQEIETAAQRASEFCRELLVYSGRAPYVTEPIDLGKLVKEMETLLQLTNSPGIRIETDFPEESALINGDGAQLRQLVMNLITNAVDSITGGPGRVKISIENRWCEEAELASRFTHDSLPSGQYVLLSVSDTGCGMTEETLSRIFDPFFTTKFTGRGLGLAAALGIIRGHRGAISVTSDLGVGTRTLVHLPALTTMRVEPATSSVKAASWQPSGVVLIVDDEDAVRRTGVLMLERLGAKVVSVASGEEALRTIDSGVHDLRCVILDLMMPGLSGTDTLRSIRERDRSLPVLIATGYGESDVRELLGELSANGLLPKPFTSEQLKESLRAVLGEAGE